MQKYIVLLSSTRRVVVERGKTHYGDFGIIDTSTVEVGDVIRTKKETFVVVEPTISDTLSICRRGAQIVTAKDAGQIMAITGLSSGWKCLDAGSGSGFLAIQLGNAVGPKGRVITYEKRKDFFTTAKKNIERCGLEGIVTIKNQDVATFREKNFDLIFFDLKHSHTLVERANARLKPGGWLIVYSPHIEAQIAALEEMRNNHMHVHATIETIQRKWKSNHGYTHPEPSGITHTGFMTFARKVV